MILRQKLVKFKKFCCYKNLYFILAKVFEKNKEIYGKAITITRRGRWKPIKKTVNEYDEEEILRVINKLPIEKQIEVLFSA